MQAARAKGFVFFSKTSSSRFPDSRSVFIEISNVVRGSNSQRRGRSFAASVPSDSSKPHKLRRRVPINERRAMVESFVLKYRVSNGGKFPTSSAVQKQLGGSYYVIRQIVQEIKYKFKLSSVNKKDEVLLKTAEEVILPCFDAKEESQVSDASKEVLDSVTGDSSASEATDIPTYVSPSMAVIDNSSNKIISNSRMDVSRHDKATCEHFKEKEESLVSTQDEKILIEGVLDHDAIAKSPACESTTQGPEMRSTKRHHLRIEGGDNDLRLSSNKNLQDNDLSAQDQVIQSSPIGTQTHQIKLETGEVLQPPEEVKGSRRDGMTIEWPDGLKGASLPKNVQEGPLSENFHLNTSTKSPSEEPEVKRSTVWGNLKYLADGIINFWRKM